MPKKIPTIVWPLLFLLISSVLLIFSFVFFNEFNIVLNSANVIGSLYAVGLVLTDRK